MKKLLFLSIFALAFAVSCGEKTPESGTATVRISTLMFTQSGSNLSYDGELGYVYRSYKQTPVVKGHQDQVITVELDKPMYYMVCRNPLYLSPGDDIMIDLRSNNDETIITGTQGVEANNYLKNRFYSKGGSFLRSGDLIQEAGDRPIVEAVQEAADKRREDLKNLEGVSREFKKLEEARIKGDFINSLFSYPSYSSIVNNEMMSREQKDAFYASIKDVVHPLLEELASDDRYLDIEVVRMVLSMAAEMDMFKDIKYSDHFKKLIETSNMADRIHGNMTRAEYDGFVAFAESIPYEDMKAAFNEKLSINSKLMEGNPAIDVALQDMDGNQIKLSDLTTKPTYIDVWATWCGPCIAESPYFAEISAKYPEINFVALSVDSNEKAWKSYLGNKKHGNITEVIATDEMRKNWDIDGIPRFLLIDTDFNIISANAPRPSETEKITAILDKLSGR